MKLLKFQILLMEKMFAYLFRQLLCNIPCTEVKLFIPISKMLLHPIQSAILLAESLIFLQFLNCSFTFKVNYPIGKRMKGNICGNALPLHFMSMATNYSLLKFSYFDSLE